MRTALARRCLTWLLPLCLGLTAEAGATLSGGGLDVPRFEHLSSRDGLAQNTVNQVFQDSAGLIWIATQGGVQRYDGYRFQLYQHDPDDPDSLSDSFVTDISEDDQGNLWFGTLTGGLNRLDRASGKMTHIGMSQGLGHDTVIQLRVVGKTLWVGTGLGLDRLDLESGKITHVFAEGSEKLAVTSIAPSTARQLFVGTRSSGVFQIDTTSNQSRPLPIKALDGRRINALRQDAQGMLWIGAGQELWRYDPVHGTASNAWQDRPGPGRWINDIVPDRQGRLWLAGRGMGLVRLDVRSTPVSAQYYQHQNNVADSLRSNNLRCLFLDRSGVLWLGSDIAGLAKLNIETHYFRRLLDTNISAERQGVNLIRAIFEDRTGLLWLGTEGAGLRSLDRKTGVFTDHNAHFSQTLGIGEPELGLRVFSVVESEPGTFWIGSNEGLARWRRASDEFTLFRNQPGKDDSLPSNMVRVVMRDGQGRLWAGTDKGLALYQNDTGAFQVFHNTPRGNTSLSNDIVLALADAKDGGIWVGTLDGLNRLNPETGAIERLQHDPSDRNSISDNRIRAIHPAPDGSLWIGTHAGLNHITRGADGRFQFQHYLTQPGLANDTIYAILGDDQGRLWLSTNRGLSKFIPATGRFQQFDEADGLQNLEFNGGAAFRSASGEMFFGGVDGFNAFFPAQVGESRFRPPVILTGFRIADTLIPVNDPRRVTTVRMHYSDRLLRLEFAALDYTAPERNRFEYQLEGVDKTWIDSRGEHAATYTNLAPGRYRFMVRGANKDGVWNQVPLVVPVEVVPPAYRTPWAYALYAFSLLLAALLTYRHQRRKRAAEARINAAIAESEERLSLAVWGSGDGLWDWNIPTDTVYRAGLEFLGYSDDEIAPSTQGRLLLIHPDDRESQERLLQQHLSGEAPHYEAEYRLRAKDGSWLWVLDRGKIVARDPAGKPLRMVGTHKDVSARKTAEKELRLSAQVIRSMNEAVIITDLDFHIVSINPAFTRISGYDAEAALGLNFAFLNSAQHGMEFYRELRQQLRESGRWQGELWLRTQSGNDILIWLELNRVPDDTGHQSHLIGVFTDITDRKQAEQELRYLANYDTLTTLPNRTLFQERLGHAVTQARRHNRTMAVLFLDLDRFKHINDSLGHHVGDLLLKAVASRLRDSVREEDTVARLGGDEFTIVLEDISSERVAAVVAEKVLAAFNQPLLLEGREVVITPSIGISLYPNDGQDTASLVKFADTAMYHAKELGRNNYQFYTEKLNSLAMRRMQLESSLRRALENEEFSLVYQPKRDLHDGRLTGVETLIRWHNDDFGSIAPTEFIPLAEDTGLIVPIGEWVLRQACGQYMRWQAQGVRGFTMAINLSARQFKKGDLIAVIARVLKDTGMPPEALELELTESMIMENAEISIHMLEELKAMGLKLAVDDFGTGYSSLSYLKRFPIDTLKIDREFVRDISTDPDDAAITSAIIAMAHSLALKVVAEGVETENQLEFLRQQGCDEIQGYYFSRPLTPEDCEAFLRAQGLGRSQIIAANE